MYRERRMLRISAFSHLPTSGPLSLTSDCLPHPCPAHLRRAIIWDTKSTSQTPTPARAVMALSTTTRPQTLAELRSSGWQSKTVKQEIHDNFLAKLQAGEELYPGIVGYDDTVIPELNIAILAQHDMLFLGEKGQAKSRLMRLMASFLDEEIPYIDDPHIPVHDDPYRPITKRGRQLVNSVPADEVPIAWWQREDRYAERLAPGTKFADIIGEIDPAKLAGGVSMGVEDALHFGLIPRLHRGIFAMNELPELDELVQVGLFNILEERDVQIRGYPIKFDIDVLILFSANPATYNRSGKVIPQLKDRIGSIIHTHYPLERDLGIQIVEQEVDERGVRGARSRDSDSSDSDAPMLRAPTPSVVVPYFMKELSKRSAARRGDRNTSISNRASARGCRSPTTARWSPPPGSGRPCSASSRPCRGSATWATSMHRRSASSSST